MKRLITFSVVAAAAAVPAVFGLAGNASFAQTVPVRVPAQAQLVDDKGGQSTHIEPGDDKGGQSTHIEPATTRAATQVASPATTRAATQVASPATTRAATQVASPATTRAAVPVMAKMAVPVTAGMTVPVTSDRRIRGRWRRGDLGLRGASACSEQVVSMGGRHGRGRAS